MAKVEEIKRDQEVGVEDDAILNQSKRGRIIEDQDELYAVIAKAADSCDLIRDLAGEVRSCDDNRLEAIQLLAKQRYEDLANAMVYVSESE